KMLKEKQIMNPLSKLIISSVFVSCVALLTFPVSSIRAIGSSEPSPNNPVSIDPEAMGVKLDLDIEAITASEGIESKSESTMTLWTKSGESKNLKINQRIDIELSAKIRPNDIILIESKIYWHSENQPRILRASPRLFTKDGNPAIIKTWSDNPDDELPLFRMKVLPNKMKYSEFKP
ncbi:MAG: hypothetical protein L3J46_11705, partial [Kangiellaceae bacterium]|nr:hypothetical protein [Kangiellaceae bacterium]